MIRKHRDRSDSVDKLSKSLRCETYSNESDSALISLSF